MKNLKKDFPFFNNNPEIVYCDSAATSQKPQAVIDRMIHFYEYENASIYRGFYRHAEQATTAYEAVREQVRDFIGAHDVAQIIFTPNATAGINLVAHAWARCNLSAGDEILLTELEHHANIVPWLQLSHEKKIVIKYIPVLPCGRLDYAKIPELISLKTKLIAVTALSNVTGYEVNLDEIGAYAHSVGAAFLVDACQSAPRRKINVEALKIDFLVFSGHKILGPLGIGVLFARRKFHAKMVPLQGGGGAVMSVNFETTSWRDVPHRYEVGTPSIADVLGLGAAIQYIKNNIDFDELKCHEASLCGLLLDGLQKFSQIKILGSSEDMRKNGHLVSFIIDGMHAYDVAAYFDRYSIAVRAGHHCAQPLHAKLGIGASVRASFYCYNTPCDVQKILDVVQMMVHNAHT